MTVSKEELMEHKDWNDITDDVKPVYQKYKEMTKKILLLDTAAHVLNINTFPAGVTIGVLLAWLHEDQAKIYMDMMEEGLAAIERGIPGADSSSPLEIQKELVNKVFGD